jgi:hypothetical protein
LSSGPHPFDTRERVGRSSNALPYATLTVRPATARGGERRCAAQALRFVKLHGLQAPHRFLTSRAASFDWYLT